MIRFVDSCNNQLAYLAEGVGDAARINRLFALKQLGDKRFLESDVHQIDAKSKDHTVKIACQLLCDKTQQQGLSHINKMIEKDFMNYHVFEHWVLISKEELNNLSAVKDRK